MSIVKIIGAVMIAVAGSLAGSSVVEPALACAAPNDEWDVGAFDQCLNSGIGRGFTDQEWEQHYTYCCLQSGGVCQTLQDGNCKCVAPPANPAQGPMAPPGSVATATLEPAPPPVVRNPGVIAPFTPAPVG